MFDFLLFTYALDLVTILLHMGTYVYLNYVECSSTYLCLYLLVLVLTVASKLFLRNVLRTWQEIIVGTYKYCVHEY